VALAVPFAAAAVALRAGSRPRRPGVAGPAGPGPRGPAGRGPGRAGVGRTRQQPSDPLALVRGFVTLFLEVEAGQRPRRQAAALMAPELFAALERVWVRRGTVGRVIRVTGQHVAPGCVEAVAVVDRDGRQGAIAVRLVRFRGAWRVDRAVRPEDGPLPAPRWWLPDAEPDTFALVCGPDQRLVPAGLEE